MRNSNKYSTETSDNNSNNSEISIAGIAACLVAAFAVIALFLICGHRGRKNNVPPKYGVKDDKPLLNLCSSKISPGICCEL